jgi:histidinol-phosphate aminotransferase
MSDGTTRELRRREFLRWVGAAGAAAGAGSLGGRILAGATSPAVSPALLRAVGGSRTAARGGTAAAADSGPGDAALRLDANENPYGPSPAARKAIQEGITEGNRYPFAEREALIDALSRLHGVDRRRILPGCGSTELLRASVCALGAGSGSLLMADPTYEDLSAYARPLKADAVRLPLDGDGVHDLSAMERAVKGDVRLVYVCNPNNPSGTIVDGKALADFIRRAARRATVLVDEAYHDYVADPRHASMVPLIAEGLPIIVTRTFSKIHGLAGLRLGYALADEKLLERLDAYLTFAGTNVLALRAALASLEDKEFLERCRKDNAATRERLTTALVGRGYPVFVSQTNFVMFHLGTDVRAFIADMKSRGVRVGRPFPPLTEHCRVSLGTLEEIDRFLAEFDRWRQAAAA